MPKFKVTTVETYTTVFIIEADTESAAIEDAEQRCIVGLFDDAADQACYRDSSAQVIA